MDKSTFLTAQLLASILPSPALLTSRLSLQSTLATSLVASTLMAEVLRLHLEARVRLLLGPLHRAALKATNFNNLGLDSSGVETGRAFFQAYREGLRSVHSFSDLTEQFFSRQQ